MVSDNVISNKYLKCVYYFIRRQWKNLDYALQRKFELLTVDALEITVPE
jgi:hypothetical protein